jgi:hypothetical protein
MEKSLFKLMKSGSIVPERDGRTAMLALGQQHSLVTSSAWISLGKELLKSYNHH